MDLEKKPTGVFRPVTVVALCIWRRTVPFSLLSGWHVGIDTLLGVTGRCLAGSFAGSRPGELF